ncbi:sensor histidine kinase [Amycolatopsis taiwanensis]|uniref:Two-component sensor histidine kinase n=1 Tax=Amycolatopsis taiwanensis TaxID=342230 RepID=A0A9W6VFS7_9PSEU|nr:sensor histidine kinase [Amycolatopsis taiwanensis]GLY69953.1 two-component sensor histidine kinase [Amycolatopsis taiwanensis]
MTERFMMYDPESNPWNWWSPVYRGPPVPGAGRYGGKGWPLFGSAVMMPVVVPVLKAVFAGEQGSITMLVPTLLYWACYVTFPRVLLAPRPFRWQFAFAVAAVLIGWLLMLQGGTVYVAIYAMGMVAFGLPPGWALIINGCSLAAAFALLLAGGPVHGSAGDLGAVAGMTTGFFFMGRLLHTVRHLRAAQREIATLAVTAERERLARDLHDILGHSLTTITVKAGLARRVLESTKDIDRAITEIHEVEGLSRSALSDVRATVSEYREVSLPAELVGAKAALRAAEIDADLPHAVDNVRTDLQQPFGYVLREAVTNVIRHSNAKQVKVRFGRTWLEVEDDGRTASGSAPGNGLRGLRERLAGVGGTLVAEPRPGGGFLVRAEVAGTAEAGENERAHNVDRQEAVG